MIDKQEFYHGAALIRAIEDKRCRSIRKSDLGIIVNDHTFVYLKYTTKGRTPWRFQFGIDEIVLLESVAKKLPRIVLGLVCGGDGVCGLTWAQADAILGHAEGWISCRRNFNEQYGVAGSHETLRGKVSLQQWPALIFKE